MRTSGTYGPPHFSKRMNMISHLVQLPGQNENCDVAKQLKLVASALTHASDNLHMWMLSQTFFCDS